MNNISLAEALAVIDNYHPCIYEDNHITDDKATNIAIERMLWKWQDDLIILREFYWRNGEYEKSIFPEINPINIP